MLSFVQKFPFYFYDKVLMLIPSKFSQVELPVSSYNSSNQDADFLKMYRVKSGQYNEELYTLYSSHDTVKITDRTTKLHTLHSLDIRSYVQDDRRNYFAHKFIYKISMEGTGE